MQPLTLRSNITLIQIVPHCIRKQIIWVNMKGLTDKKKSSFEDKRCAFDGFARYKCAWRTLSVTISQSLNKDQVNQRVPVASATEPRLIRGEAGNQVCFISLKHSLNPAKKPSPSSTPAALWNISLQIHNSPIPPWMLSKMKEVACTGALSALLSLSLSAHSLYGIERGKKESEYSSSSCTLQPFYTTCFDLLTACRRHSNGSKSHCLCIRSFSPSFTLVWLTCIYLLV